MPSSPQPEQPPTIDLLVARIAALQPGADVGPVRRAFERADAAHAGVRRESGALYIEHPLNVALTLADLNSDLSTICAGLLHDVVEDTSVELEAIRREFGDDVARLVDGVTKLSKAELNREALEEASDAEVAREVPTQQKAHERAANIRKLLLAMAQDVRVMVIKLADRLHNMQTLEGLQEEKQKRVSTETLQIFAPLAHRLGIWHLKWQLEDLAFKYLHRIEHDRIVEALARTRREREEDVSEARRILTAKLAEAGFDGEVHGRAKHLYSIWNKLETQELALDELYDLIAVRIIVGTLDDCYRALGMVHQLWMPIPDLFSDHISRPKSNMYQSLHTKVIGPRGEPLEIQIRTREMHRIAEFGVAAHWGYKEGGRVDRRFEEKLAWLRSLMLDSNTDSTTATEFVSVVEELFTDQVFVFTPRGEVVDLPMGSCPIDFAFRIHSEVGLHCTGARVNGRMVPLDYRFKNGDIVEIKTQPSAQPSYDWLNVVKSHHARVRIRAWLRRQRHAEHVARGRELLEREVARLGLDLKEVLRGDALSRVAEGLNYRHEEDMLAAVGSRHVSASNAVQKLRAQHPEKPSIATGRSQAFGKMQVSLGGVDNLEIRRSRCCLPLPGEELLGYITRGKGIAIHREGCPNVVEAIASEPARVQQVDWHQQGDQRFSTPLQIETMDRVGVMADVSAVFSERRINIERANIVTRPAASAVWDLVVDVGSASELDQVVRTVTAIPDVLAVTRPGPNPAAEQGKGRVRGPAPTHPGGRPKRRPPRQGAS